MKNSRIIESYSKALFGFLTQRESLEETLVEMEEFLHNYSEKLQFFLENPTISEEIKLSTFREISTQLEFSQNFIQCVEILIKKNRVECLRDIFQALITLKEAKSGILKIEFRCAHHPLERQLVEIKNYFEKKLACRVNLNLIIDQSLIGGCIIRYRDIEINGSIQYKLESLKGEVF